MTHRIMGIDPGIGGAFALIENCAIVDTADMPIREERKSNGGIRRRVDAEGVAALVDRWAPQRAMLEQVSASPGMGVSSAFSFGHGVGVLEAVLAVRGIEYKPVHPGVWKRALSVPAEKDAARQRAAALFGPTAAAAHWPLKKHDGRAEAAMIALYGVPNGA